MGQRRARKDTAELLSLSKSHCSHPQSGCNSTNSWFLSLKGICLRTFFSLSCFISQRQASSKRKTPRSTLENHHTENTQDKRTKQTAGIKMARTWRRAQRQGWGGSPPAPPSLAWQPMDAGTASLHPEDLGSPWDPLGSPLGAP